MKNIRVEVALAGLMAAALALASCFLTPPRWRPRLYAVEWPIALNQRPADIVHQQFPENNGLVRELRADELSTDDGSVWGVVAYLEPRMFPSLWSSPDFVDGLIMQQALRHEPSIRTRWG